jgi:hypothetical protein
MIGSLSVPRNRRSENICILPIILAGPELGMSCKPAFIADRIER